ncbi:MAG: hypothetical protein EP310_03305 [Bacteroidetes bacterium]|nr:MAG: hypothetical protein EP310_03305 [Bacteroidota bacterium]
MKQSLIILFVLAGTLPILGQNTEMTDFYIKSNQINTSGMYILGGWAVANIAGGAIGWTNSNGSAKYFHQMNVFWNTVNLGIAGFALYNNLNADISLLSGDEMLSKHIKTENLYLINAGLDVVYIGTGFLLKHLSTTKPNKQDLLKGYGNSIILQGGFLMVFDLAMWAIQRNHRLDFLKNTEFSFLQYENISQLSVAIRF